MEGQDKLIEQKSNFCIVIHKLYDDVSINFCPFPSKNLYKSHLIIADISDSVEVQSTLKTPLGTKFVHTYQPFEAEYNIFNI